MKHAHTVVSRSGAIGQAGLVLAGSALIALSAQVSVPMFPVPMTLQTLAITVIGLTFGVRLGLATVLAYLAEGAMGLPVFAGGGAGIATLVGPTGGYLWGYVGMVWLTAWLVERGLNRGTGRLFVAAAVPALLLYVPGVLGVALYTGNIGAAIAGGMTPFLIGDAVKSLIAAMAVAGGKAVARTR